MPEGLSVRQVRDYQRQGYLFPVPVLDGSQAAALRARIEDLAGASGERARLPGAHFFFRWAYELAVAPALLDKVESILGPDILLWGTLIFAKAPESRGFVAWHQDSAYTKFLDGSSALTAWIAATPATRENGCMRVIPGSHGRRLPFSHERHEDEMANQGHRVTADFDAATAVAMPLQPGEASLHEVSLIHGSEPNRSAEPRIGFIVRYATPAMRQPPYPVLCARGKPGKIACADPPRAGNAGAMDAFIRYLRGAGSAVLAAD